MLRFKRLITTGIQTDLRISEKAANRINTINKIQNTNHYLRIQVDAGGCHGFQYKIELTPIVEESDVLFTTAESKVLVDPVTLDMVKGSTLDFVDELIGSSFQIVDNPNAESSCGCKVSFNIK